MDNTEPRLHSLRTLLIRIVAGALILSWFVPGFFDDAARAKSVEFVLFLHVFLPAWAWGCYSFLRNQTLDTIAPLCRKCGYDLTGFVRDDCPECGHHDTNKARPSRD